MVGAVGFDGHRSRVVGVGTGATPANGMGDHSARFHALSGIVMALYQRQNTGKGTEVSSSLVANGLWANGYNAQAALCGATFTDRPAREVAFNTLSRTITSAVMVAG